MAVWYRIVLHVCLVCYVIVFFLLTFKLLEVLISEIRLAVNKLYDVPISFPTILVLWWRRRISIGQFKQPRKSTERYIRDSADTIPHPWSPWPLHYPQVAMLHSQHLPESHIECPRTRTLQSTSDTNQCYDWTDTECTYYSTQEKTDFTWDNTREKVERFYVHQYRTVGRLHGNFRV